MQPAFNLLVVPNPLKALQKLAEQHRDRFQIPVIGITGSNGKTIVKELAASVAESRTDDNTLSPQLQFPDRRTFVRVADE